ncbi:MAG: hypothetical protein K6T66_01020 [Peptococcaceae bacterium]|nr:hypothetical protein [Peptococcaceae bacterium]
MSTKFWENEVPQTAEGRWLKLEYFPQHGKLTATKTIRRDGAVKFKSITMDKRDFLESPEIAQLMETVVNDWKESGDNAR